MTILASTCPSIMPGSKKRCWTLIFKDIKSNVREADVISSFRKRYTSVRKLAFRSAAPYMTAAATGDGLYRSATDTVGNRHPFKSTRGRSLCVEVQFTGPQPVEGPVGLMCNLLQGTFVAANPVQLGRGRKRKVRSGAGHANSRAYPGFAESSDVAVSCDAMTAEGHASVGTDSSGVSSMNGRGRRSFDFFLGQSAGGASASAAAAAAAMKKAVEYSDGSSGAGFSDTISNTDSAESFSRSSSTASTASISSSVDDGLDDRLEDSSGSGSEGALYPNKKPYSSLALQELPNNDRDGDDIGYGTFTPAFGGAFGGAHLDNGNPAAATTVTVDGHGGEGDDARASPSLARSSSVMAGAGEELPKWDEVLRAATTSSSSSAYSSSSSSPPDDPDRSHASLPDSSPRLTAGRSFFECKGKVIWQEEVASLFPGGAAPAVGADVPAAPGTAAAAVVAAAATAAATAAGGVVVSEDGLWDGAPDEADTLFSAPPLGRHSSASWGLHPVHAAAAAVVADDNDDENAAGDRHARKGRDQQHQAPAFPPAEHHQQQGRPSESHGEGDRIHATLAATAAAADGVELTPVSNKISFTWREEECDFDGHPSGAAPPSTGADTVPPSVASPSTRPLSPPFSHGAFGLRLASRPCQLSFSGLRSFAARGYDLSDLAVFAQFHVDSEFKVEKEAGSLVVDAATGNDQATAAVAYPSMWDIWPEVFTMTRVKVVEVDMVIHIRSSSGETVYTGPIRQVTYRRPSTRTSTGTIGTAPPRVPQTVTKCSSLSASQQDTGFGLLGRLS